MATHVRVLVCAFRLWGDHGQEALENAHVCLINATATGTEILKNLVLPGKQVWLCVDGGNAAGADESVLLIEFIHLFVRYWSIHHSGRTHGFWGRCWKQVRQQFLKKPLI